MTKATKKLLISMAAILLFTVPIFAEKIVDVTVFLTNMKNDFPTYNKIYAEYFSDVQACRTTVEVKSLPTPIAIELKVIAIID